MLFGKIVLNLIAELNDGKYLSADFISKSV